MQESIIKKVLVDPKDKDFNKYRGASLLTPNLKEFTTATNISEEQCLEKYNLEYLLVTQGEDGMALYGQNNYKYHACSYAEEVYDVTGAGDTVIASMAVSFAKNELLDKSVEFASHAAALVVSQVGTAFATRLEVSNFMQKIQNYKLLSSQQKTMFCINTYEELNLDSNSFEYFFWDYIKDNVLTKDNVSKILDQKRNKKLAIIIGAEVGNSQDLQLSHTRDELAYMLSQISEVDKVIYSNNLDLKSSSFTQQLECSLG